MEEESFYKRKTLPRLPPTPPSSDEKSFPPTIAGFSIKRFLDTGGMSDVLLAIHPETGKEVVIKVLASKYLSNSEVVDRFLKEANIIALADHPNIVKLLSQGKWEGGLYIAMEYIEGVSLKKVLQTSAPDIKSALQLLLQIAYALCHLHAHGVIHRDLKLENILVTTTGEVKVIDFGIAQLLNDTAGVKETAHVLGTPVYMSPEQRRNPSLASYPSDIYSLGIIAYELIIGKAVTGTIQLQLTPTKLRPLLQRMLKEDPNERYQDVVDFIADLSEVINTF